MDVAVLLKIIKTFIIKKADSVNCIFLISYISNRKKCQTTRRFRILIGTGGKKSGYLQITICMGKIFSVKQFSRI